MWYLETCFITSSLSLPFLSTFDSFALVISDSRMQCDSRQVNIYQFSVIINYNNLENTAMLSMLWSVVRKFQYFDFIYFEYTVEIFHDFHLKN